MEYTFTFNKDNEKKSVKIQSNIEKNTDLWIVRRDKKFIKDGLQKIRRQIKAKMGNARPKFILHFDCVGRGKVVFREKEKTEMIKSFQKDFGEDLPWLGLYTYGEIGPVGEENCMHNFTAVVVAVY